MKDREKSKLLCIAMEWQATWSSGTGKVLLDNKLAIISYEQEDGLPDLYESYRFPLMWKAVEWASGCDVPAPLPRPSGNVETFPLKTHFAHWWTRADLWAYNQEAVQRRILDEIFELAVAANLIKVEDG